ncbi:MoaD/ThiS family protein [Leptospira fletcheri]|uniref:MoaD/ThiS family protein n=1 Tax=Leptospira fletcheri TaxID=2484981 RepID=A0A4R9G542_9LEPT|nr:MoaD/ThiS family protein [Leptospira fletcheri]TGK06265.1 MoaD/ThiS family protein [Leptospira fletcheri]
MKIRLLCFAAMKDYFPPQEELLVKSGSTIAELRSSLEIRNPSAARLLKVSRFAVNQEIVEDGYFLSEGQSVAVLPPSSGG